MEIPQRKLNRLSEYDYGQEGAYFVTLCTQNRPRLFQMELPVGNGLCAVPDGVGGGNGTTHRSCPTAGNAIIHKWVQETENKFPNIAIDKYVIMPDHLHLIVTIKERHAGHSLPDVMRFFKTMTTNDYIRGVKQILVRFFALRRIKPHNPLLVRAPVNSFEFQPCGRTPQVEYLLLSSQILRLLRL